MKLSELGFVGLRDYRINGLRDFRIKGLIE